MCRLDSGEGLFKTSSSAERNILGWAAAPVPGSGAAGLGAATAGTAGAVRGPDLRDGAYSPTVGLGPADMSERFTRGQGLGTQSAANHAPFSFPVDQE